MRASVLDLGSNSFHVLVADLDGRSVSPVLREREMLHLGRLVAACGRIPADAHARAVATVAHLAELARRSGAETTVAVATSALRDAENGTEVLDDLAEAAGTEIRVLSGLEEARLAYLGVRAAVAIRSEPVLVLDLGGGSLELAVGAGARVVWATSVPLGVSRLSAIVANDPLKKRDLRALLQRIDDELDPVVDIARSQMAGTTVAVGGTVRALARIVAADEGRWLPATSNQLWVDTEELDAVRDRLVGLDLAGRLVVPGMKERRADHVHVAAVVLGRVLERLDIGAVTISDWGLREGLLLEAHGDSRPPTAAELRLAEVERIRIAFAADDPHPTHVALLATRLLDGTAPLHRLTDVDRELLGHAARLHAIGEALALRRQQLHGAYLVENAELRGFSPDETALLATLVRFHRSRGIAASFPPFASLREADQDRAEQLLALLQFADGLDRAHDQAVTDLEVEHGEQGIEVRLAGHGLHVTAAELARKTQLFERTFDVTVTVVEDVSR